MNHPVDGVEKSTQVSHRIGPAKPANLAGYGEPFAGEAARFWAKVRRDESGCWIWTGALRRGYGRFRVRRDGRWTHMQAHRWAWEAANGPLPAELFPDHVCHTHDPDCVGGPWCPHRACVNPGHLEPVTDDENRRRARVRRGS
jgi:hypothetical protein